MSQTTLTFLIFSILWVITFFPSWWLMLRLLALSASPDKMTWKFWGILVLYRVVIALPYIALLVVGSDVLPDIFQLIVVGFVVAGALFSVIRFGFRKRLINGLWWTYGFFYDGLLHYAPYRRLIQAVIKSALHVKSSAPSILELGCGTGNVMVALAAAYPESRLYGVDNSSSMLRSARKKMPGAVIVQDDIINYLKNQPTGTHDLIIMQNVLYAMVDRKKLWSEIYRVLAVDGVVVVTNSDRAGSSSITKEHFRYGKWYELLYPNLLFVGIIDAFISQLSKTGSFAFLDEATIKKELIPYFEMSSTTRVYGDVNILFTLSKQEQHE